MRQDTAWFQLSGDAFRDWVYRQRETNEIEVI